MQQPHTHAQTTHARRIRKHYLLGDREAMHISGPALSGTRRRGREKPPYNDSADDGPLKEWAVFLLMLMRGGGPPRPRALVLVRRWGPPGKRCWEFLAIINTKLSLSLSLKANRHEWLTNSGAQALCSAAFKLSRCAQSHKTLPGLTILITHKLFDFCQAINLHLVKKAT